MPRVYKSVRFTTTAKGRQAWGWLRFRWWPMPLAEAELLVATEQAQDETVHYVPVQTPWGRRFEWRRPDAQ